MLRRTLIALPLATMFAAAAGPDPGKLPVFREGLEALSMRLWEVAEARFEAALITPDLDPEARQLVLLRLAEARIRAGDAEGALKTLSEPVLTGNAELPFWKAQALIVEGDFTAALALLDENSTAPGAPHFRESRFTRASLLLALGDQAGALEALTPLTKDKEAATVFRARLETAAILLDQGKAEEALTSIPPPNAKMTPRNSMRAELLRGRAQLEKGEHQAAEAIFSKLLEQEGPEARIFQNDAAVGLAKAQLAGGNRVAAIDGLIAFIEKQRDSPRLGQALPLLLECLPEKPAPDDIILSRLDEWAPNSLPKSPVGIAIGNGSSAVWPTAPPAADELGTQAIYHLALGLRREGSPESKSKARRLLVQLRLDYPTHPLAERSLLELSRWDLADGRKTEAATALATLDEQATSPVLRAEASLSAAATAFGAGDFTLAAGELSKAANLLDGEARRDVTINEAAARLAAGDLAAFDALAGHSKDRDAMAADLELERALYLTSKRDPAATPALDRFILDHPSHPRVPEARLAAAISALQSSPADPAFAKAQLDSLTAEETATLPSAALTLARIRLAGTEHLWEEAAVLAENYLAANPDDPRAPEITYELGLARYQNGDYNDARIKLEELATTHPQSTLASPALLLAARSAALVATAQAKQESAVLYDRLIEAKDPLADVARLEKARVLGAAEAAAVLLPWFEGMKKDHPQRIIAGLDLCVALYNSAGSDKAPLERALGIYVDLLAGLPENSAWRFEIQYNRGLVLERLPDPKVPSKTREAEALDVYFSVLEEAARQAPADWTWVHRCGVRARTLLENAKRWEAAIAVAERHAQLDRDSELSKEAAGRAAALKLENFVWDK
ncbi:tetratricopeptide repeat protein [Luteolibacter marinus]|uniref:tetratricopeptide repeat protein n=1 Tax=Luteolibacter marinus TaxID=2776705 RepID=UPI001866EE2B|nr:tetratricopeptide repeat protein [Luteolibacter marinus]